MCGIVGIYLKNPELRPRLGAIFAPMLMEMELSGTPARPQGRAPLLGEHTDEILGDLGYDAAEIAALREGRVV